MPEERDRLFAAVDALLEEAAAPDALPEPGERKRLREAAGLSQEQIARALDVRRETVTGWESGRTEPRPPKRAAYIRLLEGLAARHPTPEPEPEPGQERAEAEAAPSTSTVPAPSPEPVPLGTPPAATPKAGRKTASRRPANRTREAQAPDPAAADPRFVNGPLAVLDGDGNAYCVDGLVLDCPADDLPALVAWALAEARLGTVRLHRHGKDSDPLIVLTAGAAERFGLPQRLEDRRGLRLPGDHPAVKQLTRAKWQLTRRGFGPWARVYRPAQSGRRSCVQLAILPWGALDQRAWGEAADLPPAELARLLGDYAARVITPRGSTAVNGLELLSALRPPTRPVMDAATGGYVSGPTPGSLTHPIDPAPPEAPEEHPVAQGRDPGEVLDEEAYDWIRDPQLLTDAECAKRYVVGLDVNAAFAAAANRLMVGTGAPVHVRRPRFDPKMPGCWRVDLSHIELDPRLPSPFTPHGDRPEGPAWYATPTVAYAVELGHRVDPTEAYLRPENGAYFDPWYARLRAAYLTTMAELGVLPGMEEGAYLAAMEAHKSGDPARVALLSAVKATVKGGIGKLRERPQGAGYRPGERWPALERPTWSPHLRDMLISTARINEARKLAALARAGLFPVAVLSDCVVYPSDGPSPLDVLPRTPDGAPLPGGFRLGVNPGMVKHEGTRPFLWAAELLDAGHNPARHLKGDDT